MRVDGVAALGLAAFARHVTGRRLARTTRVQCALDDDDVASNICQALRAGGRTRTDTTHLPTSNV